MSGTWPTHACAARGAQHTCAFIYYRRTAHAQRPCAARTVCPLQVRVSRLSHHMPFPARSCLRRPTSSSMRLYHRDSGARGTLGEARSSRCAGAGKAAVVLRGPRCLGGGAKAWPIGARGSLSAHGGHQDQESGGAVWLLTADQLAKLVSWTKDAIGQAASSSSSSAPSGRRSRGGAAAAAGPQGRE